MQPSKEIARLIEIMAALRTPETGCPWDLAQDFRSILPYTIEEAFEVADAIERDDRHDLREELGDLLLQVVFHARLAQEEGSFGFGDVVEAITTKLVRRHPHVFGQARDLSPEGVKTLWDSIKAQEKAERAATRAGVPTRYLDEITATFPPLLRATSCRPRPPRSASTGATRPTCSPKSGRNSPRRRRPSPPNDPLAETDEIGDLLFAVVNLARHRKVDPEIALRQTNAKFARRFGFVEAALLDRGLSLEAATLGEMDALWTEAKRAERKLG